MRMTSHHGAILWGGIVILLWWVAVRSSVAEPPRVLVPDHVASYNSTDALLKEILLELRELRRDLQGALAGGQIKTSGESVITARCAKCHQEGVAGNTSGINLVLRDGTIPQFSALEVRIVMEQVRSGKMPKGSTLTEAERKAIEVYLTTKRGNK